LGVVSHVLREFQQQREGSLSDGFCPVRRNIGDRDLALSRGGQINHVRTRRRHPYILQMRQLFQNLVANAIKFRRAEPPLVDISAEPAGDAWRFGVTDNGIGIAEEYHERIFVLFQRLHGRGDYPGTGIGLAICKKIVERHGGEISLQSALGVGTTFSFTIARSPGIS